MQSSLNIPNIHLLVQNIILLFYYIDEAITKITKDDDVYGSKYSLTEWIQLNSDISHSWTFMIDQLKDCLVFGLFFKKERPNLSYHLREHRLCFQFKKKVRQWNKWDAISMYLQFPQLSPLKFTSGDKVLFTLNTKNKTFSCTINNNQSIIKLENLQDAIQIQCKILLNFKKKDMNSIKLINFYSHS